jgi:hypothetical protein
MNYSQTWDLSTIPHETLKSEWARRNAAKRGKKDVDPKRRKYLDKKADSMRRLRAKEKAPTNRGQDTRG